MNERTRGLIEIHAAVVLFGFAGIIGKVITASVFMIVWGRTVFASLGLSVLLINRMNLFSFLMKHFANALFLGVVLSLHWLSFFLAIRVSSVTIGLLTYATFPIFITFLEPVWTKVPLQGKDVLAAATVFAGLVLVVPDFSLKNTTTQGVLLGLFSALSFAILSLYNKHLVATYSPVSVAWMQNSAAALLLIPVLFFVNLNFAPYDYLLIPLLGIVCTAVAHTLFIKGLRCIKTHLAGLIASLEPVYGIMAAIIFLKELPSFRIAAGAVVILATVVAASIKKQD